MSFSFTGIQRSYSFDCFHADLIPNSTSMVQCPNVDCELVKIQNRADSTGNALIGSRRLGVVGTGFVLEPGDQTNWIAIHNLALIYHKELDATTFLEYALVGCDTPHQVSEIEFLLQENGDHLVQEDGFKIKL